MKKSAYILPKFLKCVFNILRLKIIKTIRNKCHTYILHILTFCKRFKLFNPLINKLFEKKKKLKIIKLGSVQNRIVFSQFLFALFVNSSNIIKKNRQL